MMNCYSPAEPRDLVSAGLLWPQGQVLSDGAESPSASQDPRHRPIFLGADETPAPQLPAPPSQVPQDHPTI